MADSLWRRNQREKSREFAAAIRSHWSPEHNAITLAEAVGCAPETIRKRCRKMGLKLQPSPPKSNGPRDDIVEPLAAVMMTRPWHGRAIRAAVEGKA